MKVTDDELMLAIFERHLERIPYQMLNHFVGGCYGLCDLEIEQYGIGHLFYITATEREAINVKLSYSHMLNRIKDLIAKGKLKARFTVDGSLNYFFIDSPNMINAIGIAYEFWLNAGVPRGYCENGKGMRSIKLENYGELHSACVASLKAQCLTKRQRAFYPKQPGINAHAV